MIKVKPGVTWVYAPGLFRMLEALKTISAGIGHDLTITSAADGTHSGPADPHYTGNALDIRTKDLTPAQKTAVLAGLHAELDPDFTMFLEAPNTPNEHIHCQRRVGTTYTMEQYLTA